MPIKYAQAKEILAPYVGRGGVCPDDPRVDTFVKKVLDYLLISGHFGNIRKFKFCAIRGCITVPYELETPLKVKLGNEIGSVWDRWYEFHNTKELEACLPADRSLYEDPNYYPTVYDIPACGARVGVRAICEERSDAYLIVKGIDLTGREIITFHNGQQVVGEYLQIKKGMLQYTTATFAKITAVVKSRTCGYVQLLAVLPQDNKQIFLADYSPFEEAPAYRRFQLKLPDCGHRTEVSILGRIRLREAYANNDYIPFDNLYTLELGGQAVNANTNDAPDLAKAKDTMLSDIISRDNSHHRIQNGQPIEVFIPTSSGIIRNIVRG